MMIVGQWCLIVLIKVATINVARVLGTSRRCEILMSAVVRQVWIRINV